MKSIAAAIAFTVAVFWIIADDVPAMPTARATQATPRATACLGLPVSVTIAKDAE